MTRRYDASDVIHACFDDKRNLILKRSRMFMNNFFI